MRVFVYTIQLLLLFFAYLLMGSLGLYLNTINNFVSLIWLPAGISLAALLLGGYRLWPAIFFGEFLISLSIHAPFFAALGIATGDTLEILVAWYILKRIIHFQNSLEHLRDLFSLMFIAAPIGSLISGTIGTLCLLFANIIPSNAFYETWSAWTVSNCLSTMIITPFLLIWSTKISFEKPTPSRLFEGFCAAVFLLFLCFFVFTNVFVIHNAPIGYLLFLPLVWIGLRFGQRATASAVVIISIFVFWGTLIKAGPFAHESVDQTINYLKTYIATIALTAYSLSTILTERQKLSRRKDEFISIASHELKTPITSISLLIHLLQKRFKEKTDPKSKKIIKRTNEQMEKMAGLVEDLLDISKIQMGQLVLRKERFAIDTLIDDVLGNMQHITKTHKIFRKGRTRKTIVADKQRIAQVLINLINNAIKYSPNSKKVLISLRTTKQHLFVEITDFGIGIDKKNHKKIFERFYRVNEPYENLYPGFGIGLYIAAEIIEQHHGVLSVQSTKGRGSTFSLSLPLTT